MDTVEVLLSEVHPAKLRRVCGRIYQTLRVGEGFLRVTESKGQESSSGGARSCLQVDTNHLEMLADTREVRRGKIRGMLAEEGVIARRIGSGCNALKQRFRLTRHPQLACSAALTAKCCNAQTGFLPLGFQSQLLTS